MTDGSVSLNVFGEVNGRGAAASPTTVQRRIVGARRRAGDRVQVAVDLERVAVDRDRRAAERRVDLVDVDGEDVRADRRDAGVDVGAEITGNSTRTSL